MSHSLREAVDDGQMNAFQWTAISICVFLNMIDGFDVLVMAFTAASVSAEWQLGGAQLGMLLSAGLFGMAAGSLFIAPWADRFGRRPVILFCLSMSGISMLLAGFSQSPLQLGILRTVTGLGIGGILAGANVIASEYASRRWRGMAVSLLSTGYALGATIGGMVAVWLLGQWGWRSVFLFGGLCTLVAIPLVLWRLPESLDFLLARQPRRALERINVLARRLGLATLSQLPAPGHAGTGGGRSSFAQLFSTRMLRSTLLLWLVFFLVMFGFYFVMSWTPKLLVTAGLSPQQGVTGGVLLSVGGIFGATLLGFASARFPLHRILALFMLLSAILLSVFVGSTTSLASAFALGLLIGLFTNGCIAGLYAVTTMVYDASIRTTGMGWAIGVGRLGAILSPLVAGGLIDAGWQPVHLYGGYALAFALAAVFIMLLRMTSPSGSAALKVAH